MDLLTTAVSWTQETAVCTETAYNVKAGGVRHKLVKIMYCKRPAISKKGFQST